MNNNRFLINLIPENQILALIFGNIFVREKIEVMKIIASLNIHKMLAYLGTEERQ